jgi:hypothetical protein
MLHVNSLELIYSSPMNTLVLLYLTESSFLYRFHVESLNVFILPQFDFCTSDMFFINKQFCTCPNAFPNEFTVRSSEYWAGQHWILSWTEENQTMTYFLRSRLFTYDIMKNSTAIYLYGFLNQSLGLVLGNFFFIKIAACMPLSRVM